MIPEMDYARLRTIKFLFLDMDGTIYLASTLFSYTNTFLKGIADRGVGHAFLTNNSSLSRADYVAKLARLGVAATDNDVFTSGDATILYLKKRGYEAVYLLGTKSLEKDFEANGIRLTSKRPDAVVLGFDKTLTYEKLVIANNLLCEGVPFIATHPDFVCPFQPHPIPDTGAMIRLFEASAGVSPVVIGKPERPMFEALLSRYNVKEDEVAMVGDRLYTDVRFGNENGFMSILVLSGETTEAMVRESEITPSFVFPTVMDLLPHLRAGTK